MRDTPERHRNAADRTVKDIRCKTCKRYSSEDKYGLFWPAFAARTRLPSFVDRKVLRRADIIFGPRNSWRLGASVWLVTRRVKSINDFRHRRFRRLHPADI